MKNFKARGIILREANYGEAHKMLTLLTKDEGRLSCSAMGCRSTKSRLFSCSSMFCYGDFVIGGSGEHLTLKQADVIESFYNIRTDLDILAYGTYIMEITERTVPEGMEANDVLRLLLKTLQKLNMHRDPVEVCALFRLKLMNINGLLSFSPYCINCGDEGNILTSHGLFCEKCFNEDLPFKVISQDDACVLEFIANSDIKTVFSAVFDKNISENIKDTADFLFEGHYDMKFKSYEFIKSLENINKSR